jgi:hypothetical protein
MMMTLSKGKVGIKTGQLLKPVAYRTRIDASKLHHFPELQDEFDS